MSPRTLLVAALLPALLLAGGCGPGNRPAAAGPTPRPASPSTSASAAASASPTAAPVPSGPTVPGGNPKGPAHSLLSTGTDAVALTFDDGPDPVTTPKLLALLRQYHVRATFCVIGSRARDYPDLIRAIVADGHTLCNHSWQHLQDLAKRPVSYQNWDLSQTNLAIQHDVPGVQIHFMRAPGGAFTTGLCQLVTQQQMKPLYWSVDPRDWDHPTYGTGPRMVDHIISAVQAQVHPGAVILSHDRKEHPDTITAYQTLLPWLLARYQLVPLY
jgi:peptidoglycan/xylan/chitin deacetylase (PgdA/CDA1 family)